MQACEKLGVFYLGRYHDLGVRKTLPDLLLYNSNDLLTHALGVGMTGSGKTGLCFDIIEEAAIDGIPAILIDPKGNLANLFLTFPDLHSADFEPWVNPDEARRKGLSPADKQRVLDGLEGAATAQGSGFDRAVMEQTLAGLGNRVFLLHNVHEDGASLFESRWAMSYLRGPMTRNQIKAVMDLRRAPAAAPARPSGTPASARLSTAPAGARLGAAPRPPAAVVAPPESVTPAAPPVEAPRTGGGLESTRPTLPPAIPQHFAPARAASGAIVYQPMLLGAASVRFADAKAKVDVTQTVVLLTPINDDAVPVDWAEAQDVQLDPNDLEHNPSAPAEFAALPPAASQAKNYANWQKDFVNAIYGSRKVTLLKSTTYNLVSSIDEQEGDFRVRLTQATHEQRDAAEANAIEAGSEAGKESFETIELRPNKTNISVKLVALVWTSHVRDESGQLRPAL